MLMGPEFLMSSRNEQLGLCVELVHEPSDPVCRPSLYLGIKIASCPHLSASCATQSQSGPDMDVH